MSKLKIFISYRRADTQDMAGWLHARIGDRFTLFMDVADILPGTHFPTTIREQVEGSDVLLVLIGRHYLEAGPDGRRRLDTAGDWVAEEVSAGLARDIKVVPVLVNGAPLPTAAELPPGMKDLPDREKFDLDAREFEKQANELIAFLDDLERTKFETAWPGERRRHPWPVVLAAAAVLTISEVLLHDYRHPAFPLVVLTGAVCICVAMIVRDARQHRRRSARILLRCGLAASGLGTALYFGSHALHQWLERHGLHLGRDYYPVLLVLPIIAAVAGFVLLRREIGRTAVWPSLILVLISAACFPIHVARVFGFG